MNLDFSVSFVQATINPMATANSIEKHKLVFLGEIYVGKTSLLSRFMSDTFDDNYKATIGIDFLSKSMTLPDRTVRLQLWDTAGQERFRSLIPNYIRDSSVAIIVFDVTNKQSFESLEHWVKDVRTERGELARIVIVGNKSDKHEDRMVTYEEAQEAAKAFNAGFLETSAKTGDNVDGLFDVIAQILSSAGVEEAQAEQPQVVKLEKGVEQAESRKCKC